jgi:hypothetical protein
MFRRGELCAVEGVGEYAEWGEKGAFLRASFGDGSKDHLQKGITIFTTELVNSSSRQVVKLYKPCSQRTFQGRSFLLEKRKCSGGRQSTVTE